jgi:hypothetical protein
MDKLPFIWSYYEIDHEKMIDFIRDISEYDLQQYGSMHQIYDADIHSFLRFKFSMLLENHENIILR